MKPGVTITVKRSAREQAVLDECAERLAYYLQYRADVQRARTAQLRRKLAHIRAQFQAHHAHAVALRDAAKYAYALHRVTQ